MHIILFSLSHVNCGYYGNGYNQNVVQVGHLCVAGMCLVLSVICLDLCQEYVTRSSDKNQFGRNNLLQ